MGGRGRILAGERKTFLCRQLRRSAGRRSRVTGLLAAALVGGLIAVPAGLGGCKSKPPPSVLASPLAAGEQPLDDRDARDVRDALQTAAGDARPVDPPKSAPLGRRWSDVPAAVGMACNELESAVFRTVKEPKDEPVVYRFEIRTIDGRPAELIVRRVDDERVYEAEATFGRFQDDVVSAEELLGALDEALVELGRKRKFEDRP